MKGALLFALIVMGPAFALRRVWMRWPNVITCALFWLATLPLLIFGEMRVLTCLAIAMNAAVTLANGGRMPCETTVCDESRVWVRRRPHHRLTWLGDNYRVPLLGGHASLGDGVLLLSYLALAWRSFIGGLTWLF